MAGDAPILLDVSRTASRIAAGSETGVDRVERAYIAHLLATRPDAHFLARVLGGAVLLDVSGMREVLDRTAAGELGRPDAISLVALRQSGRKKRVEATLRRAGLGWARPSGWAGLVGRRLGPGFTWLNVGHTHLSETVLSALRAAGAGRIAVMVHDLIPLDFPEFARDGSVPRFEAQMRAVAAHADLLICNSAHTEARVRHWFGRWGPLPEIATALLGADALDPGRRLPPPAAGSHPSFVTLGTIEPRKNHLLLLNLWRQFHDRLPAEQIPHLHVVGKRGWENEMVLDMLDRAPFMGRSVFEHGFVPDAELARLLADARALLFPSFAEGYGYPLVEALQMGKRVIASDLPPFREIAGAAALYLDPLDGPGWSNAIMSAATAAGPVEPGTAADITLPGWEEHFDRILGVLARTGPQTPV